ncbi:MAG TPA: hypothetical protein VIC28_18895 [Thermoanaerobaculia bacterium]|jgi:xanthine/uracil permease
MIGVLIRAVTYAALFIGLVLVYLPAQALSWAGVSRPERIGPPQLVGIVVSLLGAALAVVQFSKQGRPANRASSGRLRHSYP